MRLVAIETRNCSLSFLSQVPRCSGKDLNPGCDHGKTVGKTTYLLKDFRCSGH